MGTWITTTATNWLVYRLTGSAILLAVVGFAGQFPAFLLGPVAGIAVDRWDRHRLLVVTQTISMLQSFALAALVMSGRITLEWIVGLSVLQGLVNSFDMPARQAFVLTMIEKKADLGNAIALNSSMVNLARLIGPSIAGVVIASTGEGLVGSCSDRRCRWPEGAPCDSSGKASSMPSGSARSAQSSSSSLS